MGDNQHGDDPPDEAERYHHHHHHHHQCRPTAGSSSNAIFAMDHDEDERTGTVRMTKMGSFAPTRNGAVELDNASCAIHGCLIRLHQSASSLGTLSLDDSGSMLAVGQYARLAAADPTLDDENVPFLPAAVSVYMADKAEDPEGDDWWLVGDIMVDGQYTPEGSQDGVPLSLGGVVHLSGDGSTLAVGGGGPDNVVTVLKMEVSWRSSTNQCCCC
jgi:hypothetical protein